MLFLAQFILNTSYYMQDKDNSESLCRIIEADSEEDARMKLHKEFKVDYTNYEDESKSFEFEYDYSSSNCLSNINISSVIK
jgi:hypothetical protein